MDIMDWPKNPEDIQNSSEQIIRKIDDYLTGKMSARQVSLWADKSWKFDEEQEKQESCKGKSLSKAYSILWWLAHDEKEDGKSFVRGRLTELRTVLAKKARDERKE